MSNIIDNIYVLRNNIFILTPILISFYKNLQPQDNDLLLSYFVFPLVLNPSFLEQIQIIPCSSSLERITKNKEIMAGFEERFYFYRDITNKCIQYALECHAIKIEDNLSVSVTKRNIFHTDAEFTKSINLSSQLYKIFTRDVLNTYYAFGIKRI